MLICVSRACPLPRCPARSPWFFPELSAAPVLESTAPKEYRGETSSPRCPSPNAATVEQCSCAGSYATPSFHRQQGIPSCRSDASSPNVFLFVPTSPPQSSLAGLRRAMKRKDNSRLCLCLCAGYSMYVLWTLRGELSTRYIRWSEATCCPKDNDLSEKQGSALYSMNTNELSSLLFIAYQWILLAPPYPPQ